MSRGYDSFRRDQAQIGLCKPFMATITVVYLPSFLAAETSLQSVQKAIVVLRHVLS